MLKAYKYRIYPSDLQKDHFTKSMGCVRYIYNKGLESKIKHYQTTKKSLSFFDLCSIFLLEEKKNNEWLSIPNAQSLQIALKNLDTAFQKFFRKETNFPKFKKKTNIGSVQYPQYVSVDFKRNKIKIPKVGEVFCVFDRTFTGKIKTCTVSKTATNKYYISVLVDNELPLPQKQSINESTTVGIDLGLKDLAVLSTGEKISNPKFLKQLEQNLQALQRRASKKQKGSSNRRKANIKVAKVHEKITNRRTDFLHKLSSKIISENQTIILEDLNIAGMVKNHKLAKSISDVSWSRFISFLTYKAEWYGKNIIHIGRFEPSSKMCSCCGSINQNLNLSDRKWYCSDCHTHHDRDINAAINIKNFGLKKFKSGLERPVELVEIPGSKQDRRNKKFLA